MLLAAALWWLYFDSAAEINLKVLELSGGSPTMARAIFAVGHMLPAFALLIIAAGVGLLLEEDPPQIAYWLACIGLGIYLAGTRASWGARRRRGGAAAGAGVVATFQLARLDLEPRPYLWCSAGVAIAVGAVHARRATTTTRRRARSRAPRAARPSPPARRARASCSPRR